MPNPIFNMFNAPRNQNNGNIAQRFQDFVSNFKGDPRQRVQELLNNGSMTQEQSNNTKILLTSLLVREVSNKYYEKEDYICLSLTVMVCLQLTSQR